MLYRLYSQTDQTRLFIEPRSGSSLPYFSKKEMRERYPDENFGVNGEIGGFTQSKNKGDILFTNSGKEIPILPRGSLKRPFEWIIGYVAVGENSYVAVVRSLLSFLSSYK